MKKQLFNRKPLRNGMYALAIVATILGNSNSASAQQKVNDGTVPVIAINANAIAEYQTLNKGILLPRVALTSTTSFAPLLAHVAGMNVYNTATAGDVTPGNYYNDGTKWIKVANAASITTDWQKVGGTTAAVNADDQYVMAAKVGIGTNTPASTLDVNGTGLLRNGNTGFAFTNDQVEFGFSGTPTYRHAIKTRHNATGQAGNAMDFFVWNQGVDAPAAIPTKQVMTLDGNGNVGIGTTAPGAKLEVAGQVKITGGAPGATKVLTSDAAGLATWQTPFMTYHGNGLVVPDGNRVYIRYKSSCLGSYGFLELTAFQGKLYIDHSVAGSGLAVSGSGTATISIVESCTGSTATITYSTYGPVTFNGGITFLEEMNSSW